MATPKWQKEAKEMDRVDNAPYSFVPTYEDSYGENLTTMHAFHHSNPDTPVGSILWDRHTGVVKQLAIHDDYRGTTLLPALIKASHEFSHRTNSVPPTKGEIYSELSHNVIKKLGAPLEELANTPLVRAFNELHPGQGWIPSKMDNCKTCGGSGDVIMDNEDHKALAEKINANPSDEWLRWKRTFGKKNCPTCHPADEFTSDL